MSRSRKKHRIYKVPGYLKDIYWRTIRRVNKQRVKQGLEPKYRKEIINDYDYNDTIHIHLNDEKYDRK